MAEAPGERLSAIRGFPSKTSHTLSALSGGAAVILIVVATLLDLTPPTYDDGPAKFLAYYTNNRSQLQIDLLLSAFGTFWLAWYLGFLRWLYEGAERGTCGFVRAAPIAFGGGIAGLAVAAMSGVVQLTAVELTGSIPASDIRMLHLMHIYGLTWATVLLSVFMLSSFFIVRVTQILPEWLRVLAGIGAVLGFFQAVLFLSPGGDDSIFGFAGLAWFVIFLVYILASSINLARRVETSLLGG